MTEITSRVNALGTAWEQFKSVNDRRLNEIERKGTADPLTLDQLHTINNVIGNYKERLDRVETAMVRPSLGGTTTFMDPVQQEHKQAFCNYIRKGVEGDLPKLEAKALSVGSDPDGGYLVTSAMSQRIIQTVKETSPMRQLARVETISSDSLELIEDTEDFAAGWTTETGSVSVTDSPQLGKKTISVHELYAQPSATTKLIDDADIDVESWLAEKLADVFSRKENTAFISGDGSGKPKGILAYAAGTAWGQIEQLGSGAGAALVTADDIVELYYKLKEEYATRATFLMNRSVVQIVRLLKETTTGQYLWHPGLAAGAPDTLMGIPVMQAADMPAAALNNLVIAVGDFQSAYQIVDRNGIRILRDPFTNKPFVNFYSTKRVGGDVVNFEAIKLLKATA
jgi:HK97 family phage major capsid protein